MDDMAGGGDEGGGGGGKRLYLMLSFSMLTLFRRMGLKDIIHWWTCIHTISCVLL